jgi:dimethylglycine dehydrogenase
MPVTGLTQTASHEWIVHTAQGDITCEHVVNAGGYRCNELGAMMDVVHPVASMEHQYFLTEPIADIEALDFRVPLIRCPTDDFYSRQEKNGLLVGFYEQDCRTWGLDGIDPDFTNALCPDDPDRVLPVLENVFERMPCLTEVGIHTIINGPITYTPDGLPLVGHVPGKRNAWCITGLRAGLGEGGGHGWLLAQQIVHGEAVYDTWCLDPRRFAKYADIDYTALKAIEDYQNEFRFHMPHEYRPAGRPARTTPLYEVLEQAGAEFGVVNGWERALYYKPSPDFEEVHSFRFNNTFDVVAKEVEAVRDRVAIMEVSGFNRYEITGEGVHDWLDTIMCSRVPRKPGRVGLTYFLNDDGNVKGEATLANLGPDRVWYGSAAAAELHDMDWLADHLPVDGSIAITSLVDTHSILVVAGPRSRDLLQAVFADVDWSKDEFRWLSAQEVTVGGHSIVAMSVSFSGELAWELHVPNEGLVDCYSALTAAGEPLGLARFGLHATDSMRIEKGYRHWKADLITEFNPMESGLERFVNMDKQFVGKAALEKMIVTGPRRAFVHLELDSDAATAHPGDSIVSGGKVVGTVTSAAWGHRVNKNLAMGFVDPSCASMGYNLHVEVIGEPVPAQVCDPCQYDPDNDRVRS